MTKSVLLGLAGVLLLASACNVRQFVRTEYSLQTVGPVVATNSEAISIKPEKIDNGSRVLYPIVLKNTSATEAAVLRLDETQLSGPGFAIAPNCSIGKSKANAQSLHLGPGEMSRVNCKVKLIPNHQNHLALRDTNTDLSIPVEVNDQRVGMLQFRYRTDVEDFR